MRILELDMGFVGYKICPMVCTKESRKAFYYRHRERINEARRQAYKNNPDKYISRTANFRKNKPQALKEIRKRYYEKNREKIAQKNRQTLVEKRTEALKLLGGVCVVCKESNPRYLHLDRIKGGEHIRNQYWIYAHLNEFQILCANHHNEKTVYKEVIYKGKCIKF